MTDSEDAVDIAAARRALADPAPSIPLDEVLARNADPRTVLRDRIATAIYDRSSSSLNASNWLYAHDAEHLADAVMEVFVDVRRSPWLRAGYAIVELAAEPVEGSTR